MALKRLNKEMEDLEKAKKAKVTLDNSSKVLSKIASIYADRLMSDVVLVVNNRSCFPSHRLILCASSDVFQIMLMNPNWSEHTEKRVLLQETSEVSCLHCGPSVANNVILTWADMVMHQYITLGLHC